MLTYKNNHKMGMVTTLASLSLLGLTLSVGAKAQDGSMMNSGQMKADRMMSDMDMPDPAPVQYPIAAPGALDLYHYHSYWQNKLTPGSVTEKREMNEKKKDMKRI